MRAAILVIIVVGAAAASLAVAVLRSNGSGSGPVELESAEVREYQGEDLSSISDFRENSIKGPQYVDRETYRLEVTGLVDRPGSYTYDAVVDTHTHYKKVVALDCVEGWSVKILWEGVLVSDLLDEAEASPDGRVVIFHSVDGYTTSLPIDYLRDNKIILAYKVNDVAIPPERGFPFMLVAESKWGYKWAKWINGIEVSDDDSYRGYWEQRGYSDDGDLGSDFFD